MTIHYHHILGPFSCGQCIPCNLGNFLLLEQDGAASASRARPRRPLIWCQRSICQPFWVYGCIGTLSTFWHGGGRRVQTSSKLLLLGALKSILWSNTFCLSLGQKNTFRHLSIRNKIRNTLFMQRFCQRCKCSTP